MEEVLGVVILGAVGIVAFSSLVTQVSEEEIQTHRTANCPISEVNPHKLSRGDLVRIKVSGVKGQILSGGGYSFPDGRHIFSACDIKKFEVRVGTHGIARDGGNWDTARPEVLPIRYFEYFEIEPWTE